MRGIIPTYSQQGGLWHELSAYLGRHRAQLAGPCLTLYYEEGYTEQNVDAEVCQPISGTVPAGERVKVRDLPAAMVASAVHHGSYATLSQVYDALFPWIEANGYHSVGEPREIYLQTKGDGNQNDPDCVTEVQVPVERA